MSYKIVKKENVRKRPMWLVRLLLSFTPRIYEVRDTRDSARAVLRYLRMKIGDISRMTGKSTLCVSIGDDEVSVVSRRGRKYLNFQIQGVTRLTR